VDHQRGGEAGTAIKFGGNMFDQNGSASIQDALVLENGATSGKFSILSRNSSPTA